MGDASIYATVAQYQSYFRFFGQGLSSRVTRYYTLPRSDAQEASFSLHRFFVLGPDLLSTL